MSFVHDSAETVRAFMEAEDIARRAGQPASSAHLLLALFTFPNRAQVLLSERRLDEDVILREIRVMEDEPRATVGHLRERAREIARGSGSDEVDCLHVLIAITRLRDAFAYRLLERTGTSITALRNVAVSYVTGNMPRRYRTLGRDEGGTAEPSPRKLTRTAPPRVLVRPAPAPEVDERAVIDELDELSEAADLAAGDEPLAAPGAQPGARPGPGSRQEPASRTEPASPRAPAARTEPAPPPEPARNEQTSRPEPAPRPASAPRAQPASRAEPARPTASPRPADATPRAAPAAASRRSPQTLAEVAPNLAACGVDLTERARAGALDMAIGRDREIEAVVDILGKRRANNPVLVGPPGVGKTAIVEGLAVKIARGDDDVSTLRDRTLFALDTGALVAGTSLRGAFSERLGAIKDEVARAEGRIVVFIDELHTLIGAGSSGEGAQDAANELKTALARGEFPCVGATTADEYKKYIEKDAALERRFTPVMVDEPTLDEAILILEGAIAPYAEHHAVAYGLDAVHAAVTLSHRFINERKLPDKAFAVLDLAGSRARRRGAPRVERIDVARVVHEWSGVPLDRLAEADADRFARAEALIGEKLIGHSHVVEAVCRALRRGFAGFNGKRPMGSFLFLGPTGVGKTELVKILAEFLFGRREAVVRVDMSELSEPHAVARLIGAQPGYVGYEEGGQLTEALRKKPFQIVLFDEIEKAHKDVLALLLQILDEGHLTDTRGRRVSFTSTLVVLTSNLGAERLGTGGRSIGFGGGSATDEVDGVLDAARSRLPPELWGRLDERLVFKGLTRDELRRVALLQLDESARSLFAEREIGLEWADDVAEVLLARGGFSPATGARGMRQAIQREVEAPIAERVLAGELTSGDVVELAVERGTLVIRAAAGPRRTRSQP